MQDDDEVYYYFGQEDDDVGYNIGERPKLEGEAYDSGPLNGNAELSIMGVIESGDLRIIVVNLHERDVADALMEHAVHSITHVWVRCCGGGRVVIMMMVMNVVHNLVCDLIGNPEHSEALRLRNHVEHLCPFAEQVSSNADF